MKRALLSIISAVLWCCAPPALAQFEFGSGSGALHVVGESLPACTPSITYDYILVDATSRTDTAGGAASLYDVVNYLVCDRNDSTWRVLASSLDAVDLVTSVHGRTGAVVGQPGDYTVTDIPGAIASATLAGTGAAQGANLVGVQDALGYYTATTVEGALAEVYELAQAGGGGGGATNLGANVGASTVTVTSDTGGDAVLPAATGSTAGVMTAADKTKLDGVATGATAGLGNDPIACPAGQYASDINQTGVLTCSTPAGGGGGITEIVQDTTPQLGGDLDAQGNDITVAGLIQGDVIGEVYYCDQFAGADLWAQCQAAYAQAKADGVRMPVIEAPRGAFTVTSGKLDFCDESGPLGTTGGIFRGQGGNQTVAATHRAGTAVTAGAGFASTNIARTSYTITVDVDTDGGGSETTLRDEITCVGCDFLAAGITRGSLIETSGFAVTANNYSKANGKLPLKVYSATATKLVVEDERSANASMVAASGVTLGEVRLLKPMIETCGGTWIVEGITLDADGVADIGVHHRPDNQPYRACTGVDSPYDGSTGGFSLDCTGFQTANTLGANISIGGGLRNVWVYDATYASVAHTALEIGGQSDHWTIEDGSHLSGGLMSFWYDGLQAQPGVIIRDSQLEAFQRHGVRLSSGMVLLDNATVISADADCKADTFGESAHAWVSYENVTGLKFDGETNFEVKCGKGIHVVDGGANQNALRTLDISGAWITANDPDVTELVSAGNACLAVNIEGATFKDNNGPPGGSTLTLGNSNQGGACNGWIAGSADFADMGPAGVAPKLVVRDGIPRDDLRYVYDKIIVIDDPATACADYTGAFEAFHDGTIAAGNYRYKVVFDLTGASKLVPESHFYDDGGNWPYKACFIHHPAKAGTFIGSFPDSIGRATNGAALTINTANSSNLIIDYEGKIEVDETGLSEDALLFDLGNHYMGGCTDANADDVCESPWHGTLGGSIKPQGTVQVQITTGNDSGWTGQGIPSMSKTERVSDVTETSFVVLGAAGATYIDMSEWTIRVSGMDNDDVLFHSIASWGSSPPRLIASQGLNDGYGAILYGAQNWTEPARHWSLKNLDHALLLGDPVNGGTQVFYELCDALDGGGGTAAGTCGDANGRGWLGATYGVSIDGLMAEGPTWSSIVAASLGDRNAIKNGYFESGLTFAGYAIALGPYFCDGTTGTSPLPKGSIVKEAADCASGGTGAALAAPAGATASTSRFEIEAGLYPNQANTNPDGHSMLLGPRCGSTYDVVLGGPADIGDDQDGTEFIISDVFASSGGCEVYAETGFESTPQAYYGLRTPLLDNSLVSSINGGAPNGSGASVHWSELTGVPAGFADGSDDGGGGGSVATDSIWDQIGDIVVATGPDAATRVPLGSTGQVLTVSGGFAGWIGNPGGASSGQIAALTQKATPVAADHLLIEDSAAANAKRRVTVGSLGSVLQPLDADLTNIAALTTTAYGRGLLDDADAAATRTSIGLDSDDAVTFGSVSTADPGDNARAYETLANSSGLGTPAASHCRIGLVGATVATATPYFHCDGGSLTAFGGGSSTLAGLTDTDITTPATGAPLLWNGTDWIDGLLDLANDSARTGILPAANGGTGISALGGGVATALGVSTGSAGAFGVVSHRGNTASVDPANALASGSCNNTDIAVSGVVTTDVILWSFDGPVDGVVGFNAASTSGSANIQVYPVADAIRVRTCNPTSGSLDPGAFTINWRILR